MTRSRKIALYKAILKKIGYFDQQPVCKLLSNYQRTISYKGFSLLEDLFPEWFEQKPKHVDKDTLWWSFSPIGNWKRRRAIKRVIKKLKSYESISVL